ncbi:hypothetical protein D3C71_991280 [compost metagenome]
MRQARAQTLVAGFVVDQPVGQLLARCRAEHITQYEALQIAGHRCRAGGVARVAYRKPIGLRLIARGDGDRITMRAQERSESGRFADQRQQQIGRSIVAGDHGGAAQVAHGHVLADVALGTRRMIEDVRCTHRHALVQRQLAVISAIQHRRREQEFEGAAHREPLIHAMAVARTAGRMPQAHAEAATALGFQRGEVTRGRCRHGGGGHLRQGGQRNRAGQGGTTKLQKLTTGKHGDAPRLWVDRLSGALANDHQREISARAIRLICHSARNWAVKDGIMAPPITLCNGSA